MAVRLIYNGALLVAFVASYLVWNIFVATVVLMAGVTLEVLTTLVMRRRPTRIQWIGLALVLVLGGATLLFRDPLFIKWRPSAFYWTCAAALIGTQVGLGTNAIHAALGRWLSLPAPTWTRLQWIWVSFLIFLGFANLFVAYNFSTDVWVLCRLFGAPGMIGALALAMAVWLRRDVRHAWKTRTGRAAPVTARPLL
ncbi:septation protein IspZ [Nocardia sp. NBC_01499]|uniref:inner membrane-spanning protein YciB n=1 Tax=Nocardia sp. NBC_01499 TaxID=2903597 RepID=UPI0038676089